MNLINKVLSQSLSQIIILWRRRLVSVSAFLSCCLSSVHLHFQWLRQQKHPSGQSLHPNYNECDWRRLSYNQRQSVCRWKDRCWVPSFPLSSPPLSFLIFIPRGWPLLGHLFSFALMLSACHCLIHHFCCSCLFSPSIHAALAPFFYGFRSSVSTFEASPFNVLLLLCVVALFELAGLRWKLSSS